MILWFEVMFVSQVPEVSKRFLQVLKDVQFKKSYNFKRLKSCRILRMETAYPFFEIEKSSFLTLMRIAVDATITLLLDLK